jgi:N-acetylglucosamine-6-phosphate deacetylase
MLIGDGHHIPDGVIKTMIRAKGISNTIIVSDAAPIAGLPPGRYTTLGNEVILEENGLLHNPQKGFLVGSSATMLVCMNHLASLKLFSLDELLALGFYNPLHLIGVPSSSIPTGKQLQYDPTTQRFI